MTTHTLDVTVDPGAVAVRNFLGFGAEWDPGFWADHNIKLGVTEQDWELVVSRIRWMRLPIVRMMMLCRWCTPLGDGKFDWESASMRSVYRHLDVCQREGISVILTDWGCTAAAWNKVPGFDGIGDPKHVEAIGTWLQHLVRKKGYSCIRWFILGNEPNLEGFGWDSWSAGVAGVDRMLVARGLNLVLTGSDQSNGDDWHRRSVDELSRHFGAWDVHRYASVADVASGALETYLRAQWDHVVAKDPGAAGKPRIVAEAGMADGMIGASLNSNVDTYGYGLFMADYAVQATRAGTSAVLAWMLDDSSHEGFLLGMWRGKKSGFALRRWAYPWALLVRHVPVGSTLFSVADPAPRVRVLAARQAASATVPNEAWTFCVVNGGDVPIEVNLAAPCGALQFRHYRYSEADAPTSPDGMPAPFATARAGAGEPLRIVCPARSMHMATSVE